MTLATVDPIRDESAAWGAKAAAGDALSRVPHKAPFIALWLDENGLPKWAKANTNYASLCQMAALLNEITRRCLPDEL